MKAEETNASKPKSAKQNERADEFIEVPFDLLDRGRYLTTPAKWLYVVICSFRDRSGAETLVGYKDIMRSGGMTRNAVAKGLKELERRGYIVRRKTAGKRNGYELRAPKAANDGDGGDKFHPTEEMAKQRVLSHQKDIDDIKNPFKELQELLSKIKRG